MAVPKGSIRKWQMDKRKNMDTKETYCPSCIYDDNCEDDVEHNVFECNRWREERLILMKKIGNMFACT